MAQRYGSFAFSKLQRYDSKEIKYMTYLEKSVPFLKEGLLVVMLLSLLANVCNGHTMSFLYIFLSIIMS